jgi:hypothetical protein
LVLCAYEDRPSHLIGLKLLVCSLARHMPDVPIDVTCPIADADLRAFLARYPQVTLDEESVPMRGWDVKPTLLLKRLDEGRPEVAWIDTDILLTRDLRPLLPPPGPLVVAEEFGFNPPKEARLRAEGWKLPIGRTLPRLPNSGFVRVTPAHRPLLLGWQRLIASPAYQETRGLPLDRRPFYMLGDQDVLTSLLCSTEFSALPVRFLRINREILQIGSPEGYAPWARLAHLARGTMPALVHAKELKPWQLSAAPDPLRRPAEYYDFVFHDNSPYTWYARQYRDAVGDAPFLRNRSLLGKVSQVISFDRPQIRGFGQSCEATARLYVRWARDQAKRLGRKGVKLARGGSAPR